MIRIFLISLLVCTLPVASQEDSTVDARAQRYPNFAYVEALGYRIMNDFESDSTRVRAALVWLTYLITYESATDTLAKGRECIRYSMEAERQKQIEHVAGGKADRAFRRRKGVCIDYSLLMYSLCTQFGLNSKDVLKPYFDMAPKIHIFKIRVV